MHATHVPSHMMLQRAGCASALFLVFARTCTQHCSQLTPCGNAAATAHSDTKRCEYMSEATSIRRTVATQAAVATDHKGS